MGRVMSPTLALLVKREAEIRAFESTPFYVPEISCGGFTASGEKQVGKEAAEKICRVCEGQAAVVRTVEKQTKAVQPPRLYDLTTLQRECNRSYGYTAQQPLDYLQALYEKKLATYLRTDSQYLAEDMQETALSLVRWLRGNMDFGKVCTGEPDIGRVTDGRKVGADNQVYLGKEECYHFEGEQPAYYDNSDGSLCFVTDRADMYYFLYGEGWAHTQKEMLGCGLTADQYAEFARLQHGVLRQFEA